MSDIFESKTTTVDGRTVDYLEGGTGPTLVFLHGGGGRPVWPFHNQLTESFRVIMIEQPGFGGTPEIEAGQGEKDYATVLLSWVQAVAGDSYHLAGHSFGGRTAAWVAALAPESVLSATLLAPGVIVPEGLVVPPPPTPDGAEPTEQQKAQGALVSRLVFGRNAELEAGLAALTVPVTVVLGEVDPLFPPTLAPTYAEALPNASVEIAPQGGHVFALLQPAIAVEAVLRTAGITAEV